MDALGVGIVVHLANVGTGRKPKMSAAAGLTPVQCAPLGQCTPSGAFTFFGGFLNSHTAIAQKNASSAVHRNTST